MAGSDSHYESRNARREHFLFLFRVARGKSLFPDLWTDRRQPLPWDYFRVAHDAPGILFCRAFALHRARL
jgi:hypothetical protein